MTFDLRVSWQKRHDGDPALDATAARFDIVVGDRHLTRHRVDARGTADGVDIPLYHAAEWIAENWWSLLFEPQKNEDSEPESGFRQRHWLGSARRGFSLPDLWFNPVGDAMSIVARPTHLRQSEVHFLEQCDALEPLDQVRSVLKKFVEGTVAKLRERQIEDTNLEQFWTQIINTGAEEEFFCSCMGALGLSPYEEHAKAEPLLDKLASVLPDHLVLELCQAADVGNLKQSADAALAAQKALNSASFHNLAGVKDIGLPADRPSQEAWRHGTLCAQRVRAALGALENDADAVDRLFDRLAFDPEDGAPLNAGEPVPNLSGAVDRNDNLFRIAMLESRTAQRRFSGTRGIFLAWSSSGYGRKLMTSAKTRDQQASRAFAAELCAPISWIKQQVRNRRVTSYDIEEMAHKLRVSESVVFNQVRNNGLDVVRY